MSEIRVNTIVAAEGTSAPTLPYGVQLPTGMGITGAGGLNITGVVTAANIDGTLIAGSAINSAGVSTVGRLELSKDANIGAAVTVAGISKFTNTTDSTSSTTGGVIITGGLGVAKNVYIGAGLSVAGTLTYEDVTNVDSVGLITAKSGVNVSGGQLVVGVAYSVGAAGVATAAGFVGPLTGAVTGNADTSTLATNVTVSANNSTNETVYPLFVDGATGTQGAETDTGLTYNPSSGNLGIGGELSAASLDISGNVDVDGTMEADAITVNGTALNTVIAGVTVTNCTTAAAVTVVDESSDTTCFPLFADSATGNLSVKSGTNLTFNSSSGALTATSFSGDGSSLTGITQTTINNNADNRLITGSGTANTLNGESNLTFDGEFKVGLGVTIASTSGIATFSKDVYWNSDTHPNYNMQWDASAQTLHFPDFTNIKFGGTSSSADSGIWQNGTTLYIYSDTGTDNILIGGNGAVSLRYGAGSAVVRLATTNDGVNVTGMTTCTTGAHFQGMLREDCNIVANKLSAATNINLEDGMIHYFTTNETTTATPNIRWNSSYSLNNKMSIGETVSVTIIYKPNGAGYYAALNVDGSGVTEEWNGGTAPSSAESGGYDVLTHTLVKTADATFLCLSSTNNFA